MRPRVPMNTKYLVRLTEQEREQLEALIRQGKTAASKMQPANILLNAEAHGVAWSAAAIAVAVSVHPRTVAGMRDRCVEQAWRRPSPANSRHAPRTRHSSTARRRPTASPCAVRSLRQAMPDGHGGCWPRKWSRCRLWRPLPMRPSGGRAKKRVEAASAQTLGHPPGAEWSVCGAYGAGAGTLSPA
jgi:hypothetical protein